MTPKLKALKGYKGRDPIGHRKGNIETQHRRFKRGTLTYRGKGTLRGSGHQAGERWGSQKEIDPTSETKKYSKNSPSFDEGVWQYKQRAKQKALINKKQENE